ncbi:MAG: hypothetical protein CVU50_09850, partial [Candidatus Cloacimonetes bacterium HGW-Cloacimonetes-3]
MKKLLIAIIYITIFGFATARYSDQFPLGTYSYISEAPWFMDNLSTLISYMNQLGYNATVMETFNPNADLTQIYSTLNTDSIDVIVSDRAWRNLPGNAKYATTALSMGSYYRFEAEYSNSSGVAATDATKSEFWYGARSEANFTRIGSPHLVTDDQEASNDYTWRCIPSTEIEPTEWAYTDLRWRWLTTANKNIRIGSEFSLHVDNAKLSELSATALQTQLALMEQQYVYIKYRLRFVIPEDDETYGSTILLSFHPTGVQMLYNAADEIVGEGSHVPLIHTNGTQQGEVSQLTLGGYVSRSLEGKLPDIPDHPFVEIELKISYRELYEKGLLITDGATRFRLLNLNPRLHYKGHFILDIDYVDIEDNMHRQLMNNYSEYDLGVDSRIADIMVPLYHDMIRGIYTMDEPHQPQFHSFNRIQEMVASQGINTMTATEDYKYQDFLMDGEKFYDHQEVFRNVAEPKVIMPDPYPIKPIKFESTSQRTFVNWNDPSAYDELGVRQIFFQNVITDKVTSQYRNAKNYLQQRYPNDGKLYPVIQAFGKWQGSRWVDFTLPPAKTQTMLKYLPLCYGADGMYDYRLFTYIQHPPALDEYGALTTQGLSGTPAICQYPFTFNAILEANNKIIKYGPMLSQLHWEGALTITENTIEPANANLSAALISTIEDSDIDQLGPYGCYVECGYYTDPASNAPYLMLVNRRANYFAPTTSITEPSFVPISNYEEHFPEFDSQFISIYPDSTANTMFGTHIAFIDAYDNTLFSSVSQQIPVEIDAGDAKLLQMCGTLPVLVADNAYLKSKVYLKSVTIQNNAVVTIAPGTQTYIMPNSTIRVRGGSTLNISGNVSIADSVSIFVEQGSKISFDGAVCEWGYTSVLTIEDSEFWAADSELKGTPDAGTWLGFSVVNSDAVNLSNTVINNASFNSTCDSNLLIEDCTFNIPTNGIGLWVSNSTSGSTRLTSSAFNGGGDTTYGLFIEDMSNDIYVANTEFQNNAVGLTIWNNSALQDTIAVCSFTDNDIGVMLLGSQYSPYVSACEFTSNATGVKLDAASPIMSDCYFDNCETGIYMELSSLSSGIIGDCLFINGDVDIESRSSNLRIQDNEFQGVIGILNRSGSTLRIHNDASNVFLNTNSSIKFQDTESYTSHVQLLCGHNDFYHNIDDDNFDFNFDNNWIVGSPRANPIVVSRNWFEDGTVLVRCPGIESNYIVYYGIDPEPNVFQENNDRMSSAFVDENSENYASANLKYKEILDDNLVSESDIHIDALDGYYRTSLIMNNSQETIESYVSGLVEDYSETSPRVAQFISDYLVKVPLAFGDFQTAIDRIELRLDSPACEIDSLLAVMDLEVVLHLAERNPSKAMLNTNYKQFIYPNIQTFTAKHEDHRNLLKQLYSTTSEEVIVPVPPVAVISSNYPNPFNPSTTIKFGIPADGKVKITVYNIKGQKVRELLNTDMEKGYHTIVWNGRDKNYRSVSSGIYFLRLESGGQASVRKAMLM